MVELNTTHRNFYSGDGNNLGDVAARLSRSYPVAVFLLLTYLWSWTFWLAAIPLSRQDKPLLVPLTFMGAYGPAVAGISTLGLQRSSAIVISRGRIVTLVIAFITILLVFVLRFLAGSLPNHYALPQNTALTLPIIIFVFLTCLTGARVIASIRSGNPLVRKRMASLLPSMRSARWAASAWFSYAGVMLVSAAIGGLLDLEIAAPRLWQHPFLEATYLLILIFLLTLLVTGGNEEPGWRGFMLTELQNRVSPLGASLIIAVFWSLCHLPLYLNGFYPEGIAEGMLGRSVYTVPLAIVFTWLYNRTGGDLFLLACFHATVNVMSAVVPHSDAPMMALWAAFAAAVIFKDKMYRRLRESEPHYE